MRDRAIVKIPGIARIDEVVRAAADAYGLPGASVAVAMNDRVVFASGYGMRNLGESLGADADTAYSIASVSKQFTAAAVLRLVERGLASLEDRPALHVDWASYPSGVTLRTLLAHTSGIPDFGSAEAFGDRQFQEASPEQIAALAGRDYIFEPNAGWQYSNTGYVILAAVVESISGRPFHEFLEHEVLAPLGLRRIAGDSLERLVRNAAVPYSRFALGSWERAREWHPDWELGAGGLHASALDLLRWNTALRRGQVVSDEHYALMTTAVSLADGTPTTYGLGLEIRDVQGIREVRHNGQLPGFCSNNVTYPELGLDIVVLTNCDGFESYYSVVRPILAALTESPDLAGSREPLATTIDPLVSQDVLTWITSAIDGTLKTTASGQHLRDFLTERRVTALRDLSRFGRIADLRPFDRFRNGAMDYHSFVVTFERGTLLMNLALRDGLELESLHAGTWYPQQ